MCDELVIYPDGLTSKDFSDYPDGLDPEEVEGDPLWDELVEGGPYTDEQFESN